MLVISGGKSFADGGLLTSPQSGVMLFHVSFKDEA